MANTTSLSLVICIFEKDHFIASPSASTTEDRILEDKMMNISSEMIWWLALLIGTAIVCKFGWSRFDRPSYSDESQFFRLYAPRFAAPNSQYRNARLGYVAVLVATFVSLSLFPKLLMLLALGTSAPALPDTLPASTIPLVMAMILIGSENVPGVKQFELWLRSALHALGQIPDGVRRTVSQMKGAQFDFKIYSDVFERQRTQLCSVADSNKLDLEFVKSDAILHAWFKLTFLLDRASRGKTDVLRISDSFFDTYEEELVCIRERCEKLVPRVSIYASERLRSIPVNADDPLTSPAPNNGILVDTELQRELRKLRDRLFTFIACGLRSNLKSEGPVSDTLIGLGFDVRPQAGPPPRSVLQLAGEFLAVVLSMTFITVFVSTQFIDEFIDPEWPEKWKTGIPIPQEPFLLHLWTLFSALFQLAAVAGALALRATAISKFRWFDIAQDKRERPVSKYAEPTIVGVAFGYLALCIVGVIALPKPINTTALENVVFSMQLAISWTPLAVFISFFALWLSDADFRNTTLANMWIRATLVGLALAIVGGLISYMNTEQAIKALNIEDPEFERVAAYADLMVAGLIALLATLLMFLVQRQERIVQAREDYAEKWLTLCNSDGSSCDIWLEPCGEVIHKCADADVVNNAGTWNRHPEGHVIKWQQPLRLGERRLEGHGVLLRTGDTIIFEQHMAESEHEAEFVAQVTPKANGALPSSPEPASVPPLLPAQV